MNITIELLFSFCMFNVQARDLAACQTLSKALVTTYKQELTQVDRVEQDIASKLPAKTRLIISTVSALQSGNIYVPLVNKEW